MQLDVSSIHQNQPVLAAGVPIEQAKAAFVMLHGRGADAQSILTIANDIAHPALAYFAPQASGSEWYPRRFIEPIQTNQPHLDSALQTVDSIVKHVIDAGIDADKIMLLGFSQGACLALEYSVRHARRYGGVFGLSGGLIGDNTTTWEYPGSLDGTPVFLGCDPRDFHIPESRVHESAVIFERFGAQVTKRMYPQMGHTINQDEIEFVKSVVASIVV